MKIGSFEAKPVAPASASERKGAASEVAAVSGTEASAQVALSSAASSLMVKVADDPAFDAAKVERIAAAIRDGKFQVNAEVIAEKLIVNAEELLGRKLS
jgi:negative regulator of flagellin synthesis FlgM